MALLHGSGTPIDRDVPEAAARAAALTLDRIRIRIRITAELHRQSDEIRESGARLLAVEEREREALAARLDLGPRRRLAMVRALLDSGQPDSPLAEILQRLKQVDNELDRLAHGLLPHAVAHGLLEEALIAVTSRAPFPVTLRVEGPVDNLPSAARAIVCFVVSEGMTNVARHAGAAHATVTIRLTRRLRIEVHDDGIGGASTTTGQGLQSLADRVTVAGGTFVVDSPNGGPTTVAADLPSS